jgi:hypothetical protein
VYESLSEYKEKTVKELFMPGGLLQLAAYGAQNYFFHNNPQVTYFKQVHKTYTNFACESIRLEVDKRDINIWDRTILKCKVRRYADLVSEMYLVLKLPDVFITNEFHTLRWVKRFGESLIESCSVMIGGAIVDTQYGEWLQVWHQLSMEANKLNMYNRMIGHTTDMYEPDLLRATLKRGDIFIKGRSVIVPLSFWFNKNYGTALPLQALQYSEVTLTITLRPLRDLYFINLKDGQGYIKPLATNELHHINRFNQNKANKISLDIEPYIEANYIFLDEGERDKFSTKSLEYLIDQVTQVSKSLSVEGVHNIDLVLQNPVKEIIWVLKPFNYRETNSWSEYISEDVMEWAKIMFNGKNRIEEKPGEYFNLIQPFQHHTSSPLSGVFVYSFALRPEAWQPTGSCNMSRISSIQLQVKVTRPCEIIVYAVNMNFLRVSSGMANVAFHI